MHGVVYCDNHFNWVLAPVHPGDSRCSLLHSQMSRSAILVWFGSKTLTAPVRSYISQPICSLQTVVHTSKMSLAPATVRRCEPDNLQKKCSRVLFLRHIWRKLTFPLQLHWYCLCCWSNADNYSSLPVEYVYAEYVFYSIAHFKYAASILELQSLVV